jgi:hypothetical protein
MHLPFGLHHLIFGVRRQACLPQAGLPSLLRSVRNHNPVIPSRAMTSAPSQNFCAMSPCCPAGSRCHADRSDRVFSCAPLFRAPGCGAEGSWQRLSPFSPQWNHLDPPVTLPLSPKPFSSQLPQFHVYNISYYDIFPGPGPLVLPSTCPVGPTREITVS